MTHLGYLLVILLLLSGCSAESPPSQKLFQCVSCHTLEHDKNHQQDCVICHKGQEKTKDKATAHLDMIAEPAHPDHMEENCGSCHSDIVAQIPSSSHFTLKNSTNLFRQAFGADGELENFREVTPAPSPESELELVDDLLRRRCFRCHVYYKGDNYPATQHGTGCGACHVQIEAGQATSHILSKPTDKQCLTCHYGNYVGFDYYGRFEHDFNNEYRTPYTTREDYFRPYGVEYHQLRPDIHQQKGMSCIDCHSGAELMYDSPNTVSCSSCHTLEEVQKNTLPGVAAKDGGFIFTDRSGTVHELPLLQHPAHFASKQPTSCQACHAQWAYNDSGKHLLRTDTDDQEAWFNLFVQGSAEVETIIENNVDYDKDELSVQMSDKLTGQFSPGIWIKGYIQRRWETVELGFDEDGVLTPMRPMLDYHLSWIDDEEEVRFESITPQKGTKLLLPYVPHTTGSAGMFYQQRIDRAIKKSLEISNKK